MEGMVHPREKNTRITCMSFLTSRLYFMINLKHLI